MGITIDKAIKDLQARVDGEFSIEGIDDCEDMKLGVEAMKRHKRNEACFEPGVVKPLPGETK